MKKNDQGKLIEIKDARQPLSTEKCKAILNKNGVVYTDEEVLQIRNYLYRMAAATWKDYQANNKQNLLIQTAA